jgi:hypothetical protein
MDDGVPWQLRDPAFLGAIQHLLDTMGERVVLAGTVGVQAHLAAAVGIDKLGPPAHAIEVVVLEGAAAPASVQGIPVQVVDALGFDGSVSAGRQVIELGARRFVVACPEHIVGMILGAPDLPIDAKWACFVLMRTFEDRLDLEEARGFLKRTPDPERQALLAELAYLAA